MPDPITQAAAMKALTQQLGETVSELPVATAHLGRTAWSTAFHT
jgi:hypothetical protein